MPGIFENIPSPELATDAAFIGLSKDEYGRPIVWENTYACGGGEASWNSKSADKGPEFCNECQSMHSPLRSRWIGPGAEA